MYIIIILFIFIIKK